MKKLYKLFLGLMIISTAANAQVVIETNFDTWLGSSNDSVPSMWAGAKTNFSNTDSISKITSGAVYGNNAVSLQNSGTSGKRFSSNPVAVTGGQTYEIKFWIKGEGEVATRMWSGNYDGGVTYVPVNAPNWTMMTGTVTAGATAPDGEFILYVRKTVASAGFIQLDSIVVSNTSAPVGTPATINQIQFSTIPPYISPYDGQLVETSGTVTAVQYNGYYIQDGAGAYNGVFVLDYINVPSIGDVVAITATVDEFFEFTTVANPIIYNVTGSATLPTPTNLSTLGTSDEMYEGVLVKVTNAACTIDTITNGGGEWTVDDGSGALTIDNKMFNYNGVVSTAYDVTGVLDYSFSEFKLQPRDANDVQINTSIEEINNIKVSVYPNPVSTFVAFELSKNNFSVQLFDITGKKVATANALGNRLKVSTSDLNNGIYFYSIFTNDGSLITTNKFVVNK